MNHSGSIRGIVLDRSFLEASFARFETAFRSAGVDVVACDCIHADVVAGTMPGLSVESIPYDSAVVSFPGIAAAQARRRAGGAFSPIVAPSALRAFMRGPVTSMPWARAMEVIALGGGYPMDPSRSSIPWRDQEMRAGMVVEDAGPSRLPPVLWNDDTEVVMRPWRFYNAEARIHFVDGVVAGVGDVIVRESSMAELQRAALLVHGSRRSSEWFISAAIDYASMAVSAWPRTEGVPRAMAVDVGYTVRDDRFSVLSVHDPVGLAPLLDDSGSMHEMPPPASFESAGDAYVQCVLARWSLLPLARPVSPAPLAANAVAAAPGCAVAG